MSSTPTQDVVMQWKSSLKPVKKGQKEEKEHEKKSDEPEALPVLNPLYRKKSDAKNMKKYKIVAGPNNTFKLVYDD